MLYKKYHRNFVRKFKKGTKFACGDGNRYRYTVERNPYYAYYAYGDIRLTGIEYHLALVLYDGKINKYIHVV